MNQSDLARFEALVSPEPNSGCWLWEGKTNEYGYGYFYSQGRHRRAHRLAFEHHCGPVPAGLDLDHLCRVRLCVNPDHLDPVSRSENMIRSPLIGEANREKPMCSKGHAFDEANTYYRKDGRRGCRECNRHSQIKFRRKQ